MVSKNMNWVNSSIMEISDDFKFEFFNDKEIKKIRILYTLDEEDENKNIKLMFNYREFQGFINMINEMDYSGLESLKNLIEKVND